MKVAACKYPVGRPADFAAFADKQRRLREIGARRWLRTLSNTTNDSKSSHRGV